MLYLGFRGVRFSLVVALFVPESNSFPYSKSYITLTFVSLFFSPGLVSLGVVVLFLRIGVSLGVLFLGGWGLSFPVAV